MLWQQTEWDDTRQLLRRKLEQEQGSKEAADDLSELSEGEKEKNDGSNNQGASVDNSSNAVDPRMNSIVSDQEDEEGEKEHLYIVLIR